MHWYGVLRTPPLLSFVIKEMFLGLRLGPICQGPICWVSICGGPICLEPCRSSQDAPPLLEAAAAIVYGAARVVGTTFLPPPPPRSCSECKTLGLAITSLLSATLNLSLAPRAALGALGKYRSPNLGPPASNPSQRINYLSLIIACSQIGPRS